MTRGYPSDLRSRGRRETLTTRYPSETDSFVSSDDYVPSSRRRNDTLGGRRRDTRADDFARHEISSSDDLPYPGDPDFLQRIRERRQRREREERRRYGDLPEDSDPDYLEWTREYRERRRDGRRAIDDLPDFDAPDFREQLREWGTRRRSPGVDPLDRSYNGAADRAQLRRERRRLEDEMADMSSRGNRTRGQDRVGASRRDNDNRYDAGDDESDLPESRDRADRRRPEGRGRRGAVDLGRPF